MIRSSSKASWKYISVTGQHCGMNRNLKPENFSEEIQVQPRTTAFVR